MVRREEVELTEETLGTGGWGEVKVANFRGLRVAAKFLHKVIISNYNRRQFSREMAMAAKIRHPNMLLFIGATREGEAVILTAACWGGGSWQPLPFLVRTVDDYNLR